MRQERLDCSNNFSLLVRAWQKIQDNLYQRGGIRTWLVNTKGYILVGSQTLPPFCARVQKNLAGKEKCAKNYQGNCFQPCEAKVRFPIFKCHAGLTNFTLPLVVQGQVLGAVVGGGIAAAGLKNSPPLSSNELQQAAEAVLPSVQTFTQTLEKQLKPLQARHAFALQARWNQMMRDDLTGLGNKQYLHYRLGQELPAAKRRYPPLCLLAVRLENLNAVNQKSGHPAGDALLREFAALLARAARGMDIAVRYGGNIFVLLLFKSNQQEGVEVAHRLLSIANQKRPSFELKFKLGLFACTPTHRQPEVLARSIQLALEQVGSDSNPLGILPLPSPHVLKQRKRRVVITGLGIVSPLGCDKETFRRAIYEGRSGIRRLTLFDPEEFSCQIGGEVRDFDPLRFIEPEKLEMLGRATTFAVAAAKMAVADAGLDLNAEERNRVCVSIGSAVAGLEFGEAQVYNFLKFGAEEISPHLSTIVFGGAVSSETSIALGVEGHSTTLSTGCAAGTDAVGEAFHQIREGKADIVLGGGADAPIRQVIFGSFCTIEALSTHYNYCPEEASRPFDRTRDGFVIAEGAGMLVLEELQHALRRGAYIYGEVLGFGASNDAYHMSQPTPSGKPAAEAMRLALRDARLEARQIEYINAHGSSTSLNDSTETQVIKEVFGKHAYRLAVSSTKSMLGHSIGGAGALELITCLLGMESNFIPPTINYEFPDPACDLDYVPNQARDCRLNIIFSNSLGFGGKNACIIVGRY